MTVLAVCVNPEVGSMGMLPNLNLKNRRGSGTACKLKASDGCETSLSKRDS